MLDGEGESKVLARRRDSPDAQNRQQKSPLAADSSALGAVGLSREVTRHNFRYTPTICHIYQKVKHL